MSRQWVARFVSRHRKELSRRSCKALADKRAGTEVLGGVVSFCVELKTFLKQQHFIIKGRFREGNMAAVKFTMEKTIGKTRDT